MEKWIKSTNDFIISCNRLEGVDKRHYTDPTEYYAIVLIFNKNQWCWKYPTKDACDEAFAKISEFLINEEKLLVL